MLGDLLFIQTVLCVLCFKFIRTGVDAFDCKFPNEGCRVNKDCCSGKCVDAHPGTNPRCTRLSLHHPCLYTYQCDDRLRCGTNNTCCSKYWGTCTKKADCCDPQHSCYEVEGFYYKRCLYASSGEESGLNGQWPPLSLWCRRLKGHDYLCTSVKSFALSILVLVVVGLSCAVTTGNGVLALIENRCDGLAVLNGRGTRGCVCNDDCNRGFVDGDHVNRMQSKYEEGFEQDGGEKERC